jgi:hypothetical protein
LRDTMNMHRAIRRSQLDKSDRSRIRCMGLIRYLSQKWKVRSPRPDTEKPGPNFVWYFGNPAVSVRPVGFPPHSREWFSIIVYHLFILILGSFYNPRKPLNISERKRKTIWVLI